ncbi:MAG: nicotinamide mononucleotide transporter [Prevotella sp.]|nr:nicotinamide mononucleotide transporter [Prevotella sp.]MBR6494762.1 nicotinamide mononucleotide transporter [Prevotella sp.]
MNFSWIDLLTTILGLAYIILEYRASVWLWAVGFAMQSLGIVLYYQKGLYADCGMEFYYLAMTVYGWWNWARRGHRGARNEERGTRSEERGTRREELLKIRHFPLRLALLWGIFTLVAWAALYLFLVTFTDSRVPVADSFTTALSFVGIWALARKYLEQWLIWIVVDVVTCGLYFYKEIPFKASLYGLYVVIAIAGYRKWKRMMVEEKNQV